MLSQKTTNVLLAILVIFGLYCPTSFGGERLKLLLFAPLVAAALIFSLLIISSGIKRVTLMVSMSIIAILVVFTLFTPFADLTYGTVVAYVILAMLFCVNFRDLRLNATLGWAWQLVNIGNLVLAALLIAEQPEVKAFFVSNYSAFYDELVPNMLNSGKPVLTFGSHSLASFFFFICSYLNLRAYAAEGGWLSFVAAILYLLACGFLKSVSACFLIPIGVAELIAYTWGRRAVFAFVAVMSLGLVALAVNSKDDWIRAMDELTDTLSAEHSGIQGRYSSTGVLAPNIEYISEHPFRPIGIGYSESLWYADSGPAELMLRGSLPLLVAVYGGFWLFLRNNCVSRATARVVFASYVAFEFGFGNLLYYRTLCFIPFVVVSLNHVDHQSSVPASCKEEQVKAA